MRRDKYLSLTLSVIFLVLGTYLLYDSGHDSAHADGSVIAGAVLWALALAGVAWAVRQHLLNKALRHHLRRHHSH